MFIFCSARNSSQVHGNGLISVSYRLHDRLVFRFRPTCSVYMIQAIEKHGLKGVLMGIARILRCHPLSETGDDPVPDYFSLKRKKTPLDN